MRPGLGDRMFYLFSLHSMSHSSHIDITITLTFLRTVDVLTDTMSRYSANSDTMTSGQAGLELLRQPYLSLPLTPQHLTRFPAGEKQIINTQAPLYMDSGRLLPHPHLCIAEHTL